MNVYLDTNIIMEFLGHRPLYNDVKAILKASEQKALNACISANSLDTIIYLLGLQLKNKGIHEPEKREKIRESLTDLLKYIDLVSISKDGFISALADTDFNDIEDSVQYHCASENGYKFLVTINTKDFKKKSGDIIIISPDAFVKKHIKKING